MKKSRFRITIRTKITVLVAAAVFFATGVYGTYTIWQFREDKIKFIYDTNAGFTKSISRKLQSDVAYMGDAADSLGKFLEATQFKDFSFAKFLFRRADYFVSFHLFDRSGSLVTQEYVLANKNYLALNRISARKFEKIANQIAKSDRKFKLGSQIFYSDLDPDYIVITHQFGGRYASKLGLIFASKNFIRALTDEAGMHQITIVSKEGEIVAHRQGQIEGQTMKNNSLYLFAQQSAASDGGKQINQLNDGVNMSYLGYYSKIGNGLIVMSLVDVAEAFSELNIAIKKSIFLGLILLVILILAGVYFSVNLTEPLKRLMAMTEELAAGNYLIDAKIKTRDEIGELGDYFMGLGQKLNQRESELEHATELAIRDGMTGLYNHRHFRSELEKNFARSQRSGEKMATVLIDVDFFKRVNDNYGHPQGDLVLKNLAKLLQEVTRKGDICARYGGEEFVCVLNNTDLPGAVGFAEKVRKQFAAMEIPNLNGGAPLRCTMSLGVGLYDGKNYPSVDALVTATDANLYKAKQGGRNRVRSA